MPGSRWASIAARTRACSAGGRAWSISPLNERTTSRQPIRTMFADTSSAITGSNHPSRSVAHQDQSDHHADRGPHVGQQVLAVGFQDDRPVPPADAEQPDGDDEIDQRRDQRDDGADRAARAAARGRSSR